MARIIQAIALVGWLSLVDSLLAPSRLTTRCYRGVAPRSSVEESEVNSVNNEEEEKKFKDEIRSLCAERNLGLAKVKNCRDLASVQNSPIKPGKIFRTGRLGDATAEDKKLLFEDLGITTLVDLRSPTELKDDPALMADVFSNFTDLVWIENGRRSDGCVRELDEGVSPVASRRYRKANSKEVTDEDEDAFCDYGCDDPQSLPADKFLEKPKSRRERHFVSLMNEFKYVRGTVTKLRKRDLTRSLLKSPGAIFSKRIWNSLKKPFIREINDGGLTMLNDLLSEFRWSQPLKMFGMPFKIF